MIAIISRMPKSSVNLSLFFLISLHQEKQEAFRRLALRCWKCTRAYFILLTWHDVHVPAQCWVADYFFLIEWIKFAGSTESTSKAHEGHCLPGQSVAFRRPTQRGKVKKRMVGYDTEKENRIAHNGHGAAGILSAILTRYLAQPLDVLKIRFQVRIPKIPIRKSKRYTMWMKNEMTNLFRSFSGFLSSFSSYSMNRSNGILKITTGTCVKPSCGFYMRSVSPPPLTNQ